MTLSGYNDIVIRSDSVPARYDVVVEASQGRVLPSIPQSRIPHSLTQSCVAANLLAMRSPQPTKEPSVPGGMSTGGLVVVGCVATRCLFRLARFVAFY